MPEFMNELIGPYEAWAYGAGAKYVFGGPKSPHVAALAELPQGVDPRHASPAGNEPVRVRAPSLWEPGVSGSGRQFWPLVLEFVHPPGGAGDARKALAGGLATLRTALAGSAGGDACGFRLNTPVPERCMNPQFAPGKIARRHAATGKAATPPRAIMAVIDDGIPFAHRNFRDRAGKSRLEFCWLQGADAAGEAAKQTVLFGRELLCDDIDALTRNFGHDEDLLYREAGAIEKSAYPGATIDRFGSHGAHVLDAAAGHRHGSAPDAQRPTGTRGDLDDIRVIAVQLPARLTLDTAGFGKDAFVLSALHYIFERADRLAEKYLGSGARLPLVINFSYGFSGGPHNGRERLERAIRALIEKRMALGAPTELVMPSGNEYFSALHGEITRETLARQTRGRGDALAMPWRIQPGDHSANYLEIWLPEGIAPDRLSVEIDDPAGRRIFAEDPVKPPSGGTRNHDLTADGSVRAAIIGQFSVERYGLGDGRWQWRLVVAFAPTEPDDPVLPATQAGLWSIRLAGLKKIVAKGAVACRIQRDNDPFGYARGARQSYFDLPEDERFDEMGRRPVGDNPPGVFVRRFGTLNGLATHDRATVVGSFVRQTLRPAHYSSAGPEGLAAGAAGSVRWSAASDLSGALRGMRAAGTRSGAVFRLDGTSTAAPQIARLAALALTEANASIEDWLSPVEGAGPEDEALRRLRLGKAMFAPAGS